MRAVEAVETVETVKHLSYVEVIECDGCHVHAYCAAGLHHIETADGNTVRGTAADLRFWTTTTTEPDCAPGAVAKLAEPRLHICPVCWGDVRAFLARGR
jgi:hypothetical protein